MKQTRLAQKIIRTQFKDRIYYPSRLVVDTIRVIARCGILLILYSYVFELNNGTINGVSYVTAAWSMFFYFAFSVLVLRHISQAIMEDVRRGTVEILFSKPISYLSYRMAFQVGKGLYSFLVIGVSGALVLALLVGFPVTATSMIFIPTMIVTFVLGVILSLLLYSIIGLLAFWIEDINPIFWTVDKAVMILGGSYLPVALFPTYVYALALYSPFGATQFITHTVYHTWQTEWYFKIGMQVFWVIALGAIVHIVFQRAKQKVSVNGG
ncbi:ABC-2 family transporter protein [Candidatus Kaiserbacteria bacterium]|nr:ABC-2 family transporter protein [Candidatus Kaiserbacteria bacterium]